MTRIAWVTHREWGKSGGAESADFDMVERRPEAVTEVTVVSPGGVAEDLVEYDRVVVTGMYGFSDRELNTLADLKPIMWVHDTQFAGHFLVEAARTVILLTPQHEEYELEKSPLLRRERIVLNPGYMEPIPKGEVARQNAALWAHRPEPHKGLDLAAKWADDKGIPLWVMVNTPHEEVILAMQQVAYFVLLSHIFDPGPRSVIEAQMCGAELVVDNVGYWDEEPDVLASRVGSADLAFWDTVLN